MSSENETSLEVPKESFGDYAHAATKGMLGCVPGVGAAVAEGFNRIVQPPIEKRRGEWMERVTEAIQRLQDEAKIKPEDLQNNEAFISTVLQASQIAQRNHQQEKIDALRNAVLNSALPSAPDDSRQQMFPT